jgi:hypothetical protein
MRWGWRRSGALGLGALALSLVAGCGSAPMMGATSGGKGSTETTSLPGPEATSAPGVTSLEPKLEEKKKEADALRLDLELAGADKDAFKTPDGKKPGENRTGIKGKPDKVIQDDRTPGGTDALAGDQPDPKPTPAAATGERLSGNVDPASVRTTLTGARDVLRRCSDSDIKLELDLTITPSGDVMEASASSSAPDDVRVRDCVVSALRKLRFQPFGGSEAARISLGLALRR